MLNASQLSHIDRTEGQTLSVDPPDWEDADIVAVIKDKCACGTFIQGKREGRMWWIYKGWGGGQDAGYCGECHCRLQYNGYAVQPSKASLIHRNITRLEKHLAGARKRLLGLDE